MFLFGETSNEWGLVTCTVSSQKSFLFTILVSLFNVIHEFPHKFVGKNEIIRVYTFHWHVCNVWAIFLKFCEIHWIQVSETLLLTLYYDF